MGIIYTIIAAIFSIFIVILIHELGHFFVAKWCGVKVLKFSIGFGKAIWSYKSKSGTEYVLAWIPLGGYVKMLGENEPVDDPAEYEYAYQRKPLWKRMAIVAAGPFMNFVLAVFLFACVYFIGVTHIKPVIGQVEPNTIASQGALRPGDEIVKIDGWNTPNWQRVMMALVLHIGERGNLVMTVRPKGSEKLENKYLPIRHWKVNLKDPRLFQSLGFLPYIPKIPPVVAKVLPNSPADKDGLKAGDRIIKANGKQINDWMEFLPLIQQSPGKTLRLIIERDNKQQALNIKVGSKKENDKGVGFLGVYSAPVQWPADMQSQLKYSTFSAWWPALKETWTIFSFNFIVLTKMITGKISLKALGGPITIAQTAGQASSAGLIVYFSFIAFISVTLAFINVLPIPGLDGGHLFFQIIEGIFRRPIPERVQALLLRIGIIILILIMLQATLNDILRIF